MRQVNDIRPTPTSKQGFNARCACCSCFVWVDTTHGTPPGPDLCSQFCFDRYNEQESRRMPAWAVD